MLFSKTFHEITQMMILYNFTYTNLLLLRQRSKVIELKLVLKPTIVVLTQEKGESKHQTRLLFILLTYKTLLYYSSLFTSSTFVTLPMKSNMPVVFSLITNANGRLTFIAA